MNGVNPTMAMPEFTIDKGIRHFITDMGAYLSCFHKQVSDDQKAYLLLSAVKGDAKDILLGYSEEQLNTVVKIFQVLREEFKKREKCVLNLYQIKQEVGEKVIIVAGKIRRYTRALGVNNLRFDNVCIDYLKIGTLPHIQNRLYQRDPKTFRQALQIATDAEMEEQSKPKAKETTNQVAVVKEIAPESNVVNQVQEVLALIALFNSRFNSIGLFIIHHLLHPCSHHTVERSIIIIQKSTIKIGPHVIFVLNQVTAIACVGKLP
jgi:hypothetical protein